MSKLSEYLENLKAIENRAPVIDCGDNSCIFATQRGGMRTNGGCQCFQPWGRSQLNAARVMLPEILKLREQVAALPLLIAALEEAVGALENQRDHFYSLKSPASIEDALAKVNALIGEAK